MKHAVKQSTLLKSMSLGTVALAVIITLLFFFTLSCNKAVSNGLQEQIDLTEYVNQFLDGSQSLTDEVRAHAATGDKTHYDNYWDEINNLQNREKGIAGMQEIGITEGEQALIDEMSSISDNLVPLEEQAMEYAMAGNLTEAIEQVYGEYYTEQAEKIANLRSEFLQTLEDRMVANIAALRLKSNIVSAVTVVAVIAIIIMQLFSMFVTDKKVIIPLKKVQAEMEEIAKGNLNSDIGLEPDTSEIGMLVAAMETTKNQLQKYVYDISEKLAAMADGDMTAEVTMQYIGDFYPLQTALNKILHSLNAALNGISRAADELNVGAGQVSDAAQALSQGATEQASGIEVLSANMQEVSNRVGEAATYSREASEYVEGINADASTGNKTMDEMIAAMAEITETSGEIGKIIKVIEDIAFQTNILALNAAVEAARAGEAGKGFAVVADEVRNLAQKSAEAAKNTTDLIEKSVSAVNKGEVVAETTAGVLGTIVDKIGSATQLTEQIAEGSEKQTEFIKEVDEAVDKIASVIQTNAATAEESAATSEELSAQATVLKDLIAEFKLKEM